MSSTVSIFGAKTPLRDGEIVLGECFGTVEQRWYVGGQGPRSVQIAWHLLENLLDGPEGWQVDPMFGPEPSRCASLRFGNCLTVTVRRGPGVEYWRQQAELDRFTAGQARQIIRLRDRGWHIDVFARDTDRGLVLFDGATPAREPIVGHINPDGILQSRPVDPLRSTEVIAVAAPPVDAEEWS